MSEVSSESLFHYTNKEESLLGILKNGFRMSYCFEDFDEETSHFNDDNYIPLARIIGSEEPRYGIAIPMICFCDIPIQQTKKHREHYGNYCIGLDKSAFFEQYRAVINPVFYYFEESWTKDILPQLVYLKKKLGKKEGAGKDIKHSNFYHDMLFYIREIISLAKPYSGMDTEGRFKRFYDEREWRITFNLDENKNTPDLIYGLLLDDFNKKKKKFNEPLVNNYLKLKEGTAKNIITHIIVPEDKNIADFVKRLKECDSLMGHIITSEDKSILIEKTISFQQIENDASLMR
jgi:hypothetical protein